MNEPNAINQVIKSLGDAKARAMSLANIQASTMYSRLKSAAIKERIICRSYDASGKELLARPNEPNQGELPF
jgi:hypothetical protein